MLWLVGQIWLWLLISFALGAGITGLLLTRRRSTRDASADERPSEPRESDSPRARAPAEGPERISGDISLPAAAYDRFEPQDDDLTQQIDLGRRSGTLPDREDWHSRSGWPRADEGHTTEIVDDSDHRPYER